MNRRLQQKARTRSRLVEAAQRLFANRGYEGVGLRDVAGAVEMSTGAVFAHFTGKDALWRASMGCEPPDVRSFVRQLQEWDGETVSIIHEAQVFERAMWGMA